MSPRTKEMKKNYNSDSSKLDRKTMEKNRRMLMKALCFKLASLIPNNHNTKEVPSQQDLFSYAALYIKEVGERIESLKRQTQLMASNKESIPKSLASTSSRPVLPILELRDKDSILEVTLITGLHKNFMFYQIIGVLEEEGALVVNACFSTVGDKVFHTIHCQVISSRVGVETPGLHKRLMKLISS